MFTQFFDMHSGGGTKVEPYEVIVIEAPEVEAISIFYSRFGRNPHRVTCTCCGEDYAVSEHESLDDCYHWHAFSEEREDAERLLISADEIEDHERYTDVPEEGYVWVGW